MSEACWYYARGGQQLGPVTFDDIYRMAAAGEIPGDELVWREGMADWVELRTVPELAEAIPAADNEYELAPEPPRMAQVATPATAVAAPAGPPYYAPPSPYQQQPYYHPAGAAPGGQVLGYGGYRPYGSRYAAEVAYAGFWIRLVASIIDGLIVNIPTTVISELAGVNDRPNRPATASLEVILVINVLSIVAAWLYEALFTASKFQATPGKMAVGLHVVGEDGQRISFARATGRHFAKMLSAIICLIGFIMAAFDERKRGLHDMICSTYVVYKPR